MRCDRLASVIFRAEGSKFASRSALLRASFHTRPPAGTSAAKTRSARPAACSCASIVEARNARYSLQNRPTQPPSLLPLLAAPQRHESTSSKLNPPRTMNQPLQPRHRPKTPNRLDLPRSPRHKITHRLKLISATTEPLHLHAFRCSLNASKSPLNFTTPRPLISLLSLFKSPSHHHQSPLSRSPSDPLTDPLHLSKTSL